MKTKPIYITNIILIVAVLIGNYYYQDLGFSYPVKMFCSASFALLGVGNFVYAFQKICTNRKMLFFMTLGILFCWGGDIFINLNFIVGAAVFALGHVFFVVSYFIYRRIHIVDVIFSIIMGVFSISFILFFPPIEFEIELFQAVCIVYAAIISVMVGKAVGNAITEKEMFTILVAIGSVLFFVSDLMLLLAWFSSITGWTSNVCMALYYPAMCLFASTIVFFVEKSISY